MLAQADDEWSASRLPRQLVHSAARSEGVHAVFACRGTKPLHSGHAAEDSSKRKNQLRGRSNQCRWKQLPCRGCPGRIPATGGSGIEAYQRGEWANEHNDEQCDGRDDYSDASDAVDDAAHDESAV